MYINEITETLVSLHPLYLEHSCFEFSNKHIHLHSYSETSLQINLFCLLSTFFLMEENDWN